MVVRSSAITPTANSGGDIYIADLGNDRIQELAQYGEFLTLFGAVGSGAGELSEPEDIAINSSKEIYISDSGNNRIEKWLPAGKPANTQLPSISGQLRNGETLTASTGTWAASPAPNGSVTETEYDADGDVTAQTDGNKHTTKYTRNVLEQVTEITEPLGHKTIKEYDAAGNLKSLTNPFKR